MPKKLPRVALAGRRNVGKSTLFNALLGRQRAITDNYSGLTRDILEAEIERYGLHFLLSDTPGLDLESVDALDSSILERADQHLESVDLILLLFEPPGPDTFDHRLIELMRRQESKRPVLYLVNKVDSKERADEALIEFYSAGLSDPIAISALGRYNLRYLFERMSELLPSLGQSVKAAEADVDSESDEEDFAFESEIEIEAEADGAPSEGEPKGRALRRIKSNSSTISDPKHEDLRLALVGRPNAGKSSLLNRLANREVSLVSEVPGTTRDTVDTIITWHGKEIRLIDTAGLRRKAIQYGATHDVDFYSMSRTKRAMVDSELVIHLIDATVGLTDYDKKISALLVKLGRPVIVAINKWDAIPDKGTHTQRDYARDIEAFFPHVRQFPVLFISALNGQRVGKVIDLALELQGRMATRITTSKLNKMVEQWNQQLQKNGRVAKIYYAVQADRAPPEFVFFVRSRKEFRDNFRNYFENRLREECNLAGVPIRIVIREKEERE